MVDTSRDESAPGRIEEEPSGSDPFDPYHRWLGIPREEQPPNHYRLLGLALFEDDPEVVHDAAARQMAHVRTYHLGPHAELSQKILDELGAAKACLLNPQKKVAYDAGLRREQASNAVEQQKRPDPSGIPAEIPLLVEKSGSRMALPRSRFRIRKPPAPVWIAAGAAALFVLFGVVINITTGKGRIKIVLSDPKAEVELKIDGDEIEIAGLEDPIRLRPGEHELIVTGPNYETHCQSFTVRRGDNESLKVTLVPLASEMRDAPAPGKKLVAGGVKPGSPVTLERPSRWLGYTIHEQPDHVADFAGSTNIVFDRTWSRHSDAVIQAARERGLKVVLEFHNMERVGIEGQLLALADANQDVVIAICWTEPYVNDGAPSALSAFGRQLHERLPDVELWVSVVAKRRGKEQTLPVPEEVGAVVVNIYHSAPPSAVREKESVLGGWITKAAGRPVLLRWIASCPRHPKGIVRKCTPETIRTLAQVAENRHLRGLLFDSYGPRDQCRGLVSRPPLVEEIKRVARNWEIATEPRRAKPHLGEESRGVPNTLTDAECGEGWQLLFDGKTLDGWQGATDDYVVENGNLVCKGDRRQGLLTKDQFSDFVMDFEFKLTAGANNGVVIRTPFEGNPSNEGMEIQILDESVLRRASVPGWSLHGAIYGVKAAKQGYLKPVGEWNRQEIICAGRRVSVNLNGTTILDVNLDELAGSPVNGKSHPGLSRNSGHVGFLGHKGRVEFRNIRIKELEPQLPEPANTLTEAEHTEGWRLLFDGKTLNGWHAIGVGNWSVENGAIVGRKPGTLQTGGHLVTDSDFDDFTLRLKFNVPQGDSGVYFRGRRGGYAGFIGPQAQVMPPDHVGGLMYVQSDRSRTTHRVPSLARAIQHVFRTNDWNELELMAKGPHVSIRINGVPTAAAHDELVYRRGRIAIQLWGKKDTEVLVKDIQIRPETELQVTQADQAPMGVPPEKAKRWLGYDVLGAKPVLAADKVAHYVNLVASHSNIVVVPFVDHFAESSIQAARERGLKVLLYVWNRENMTRFNDKGIQFVKDNSDVVVGVLSVLPPYFRIESSEITKFAQNLKWGHPGIEYWVSLVDRAPAQLDYTLPDEVDVLLVNVIGCSTIGEVKRRKEEVWPKWIAKAGHRPVVLIWDWWRPAGKGIVTECELGTLKAIGLTAKELNLRGLLFATYCDTRFGGNAYTGIASRPALVAEVRSIAQEWGIGQSKLSKTAGAHSELKGAEGRKLSVDAKRHRGQAKRNKIGIPEGAAEFRGHYYKLFDTPCRTWHLAQEHCRKLGGHLARIESEQEHAFIVDLVRGAKGAWVDGNDELEEGVWRFSNGRPMLFAKWSFGEPTKVARYVPEHSLGLAFDVRRDYFWNDAHAGHRAPFVCEWGQFGESAMETQKRHRPIHKPKDAIRFAGHSYTLCTTPATWYVAKNQCESLGGHLVRIESDSEQRFVEELMRADQSRDCWADGTDARVEGVWEDSNGRALGYSNWVTGEPNNQFSQHHLRIIGAARIKDYGKWDDEWDSIRRSFICEWDY